ncbi:MAG: hypothetical protein K8S13_08225 [Desulfobacula sp.]|uniref:hypothetical protein n=1 Tax=Desulfobacula sp. TaxID=2593537 RepID=UPI0025BCBBDA|nr:hypothetical protein [Desulfobacula sp.]MCD4719833.1 hypothetical protein [Desulfobacula sp.]
MKQIRILLILMALLVTTGFAWASPYAVEVIGSQGPFGPSPYDDPYSLLGKPSTNFANWGNSTGRVKMVEPAWNISPDGNKLITTINSGAFIDVKFDHRVMDDPNNPFGMDFLVFGNAFYTGSGYISDSTNMNNCMLAGGGWFEKVTVSVSQNGEDWYSYINGPYGDRAFPTQAYEWDRENAGWTDNEMDFTKPVDPALAETLVAGGIFVADAIELYNGSGGGTGFDLAESGYEWIQYIKVAGVNGDGEIDAFSDVAPVPVPAAIWLLGSGLLAIVGLKRKNNLRR